MSKFHEKKAGQLRYAGIPWVTIHTPIYSRTPITSGNVTPNQRSFKELPKIETPTKPLFNNTSTSFSDAEERIIRIATTDEIDGVPLQRSPSRLQQIQIVQQELHPEFILGKTNTNTNSNTSPENSPRDEDVESVISYNEDIEPIGADDGNDFSTSSRSKSYMGSNYLGSGQITNEEIQKHIWDYCKKTGPSEAGRKISAYHANILGAGDGCMAARITTSFGMRKKMKAIGTYSGVELEKKQFHCRPSMLSVQNKQRLESSVSAMKYAKYIQKGNKELPEFLDGLDFSNAKIQNPRKKSARTQPVSPRSNIYHRHHL
ncbi:hypothetical protein TRFO_14742 [Tritrichomonas foetus]|uniref:Uncharacterized protein n=1 Tax=Tritrichomonas foetus TaxID=1144522 RepID=A0A1J4KU71_9EUKA|nr:hypothetical protein TRFO_14742 [Tritrichomonas foetus]|eukprot:OHT14815.1 hypothetical protein TRFO_14742 [Tritrichomonas foetus]